MSARTTTASEQVYATMLLSDSYLPGALVLGHSLRDAGTQRKLAALVTFDTVSASTLSELEAVYDYVLSVPRIRNEHPENLSLMDRPDLHSTFTKINLWKQTQFSKILYLDADVIAYRAPDELFDLPHAFSAAPDVGWPDMFNTGVMVLTPNMGDYYAMLAMAERGISFDGADQGLINMHFKHSTNRLSFTYNVTPSAHYQYIPAYLHFQSSISMVHFIGASKPWFSPRNLGHSNKPVEEMLGRWWAVHDRHYRAQHQHDYREPNAGYNATIDSITGTSKLPLVHMRNDQAGKDDTTASLSQRLSGKFSIPNPSNPTDAKPVEHETSQQKPMQSHPPVNSWDAQRQSPPPNSKPEAVNFPTAHYEMSRDPSPFVPPMRYPSPPKNMWYKVPEQTRTTADNTRQIFPWEAKQPTPSRSFPDPVTPEPNLISSAAEASASLEGLAQRSPHTGASSTPGLPITSSGARALQEKISETASATTGDPWDSFSRANAWDNVPEIGQYVENFQKSRHVNSRNSVSTPVFVASSSVTAGTLRMPRALRVTDFPTEVERPSLPVTPAPIRRPSFWGEDKIYSDARDEARSLPAAEGVPSQSDWDPAAQLEKLAHQHSEALLRGLSEDRRLT
ncbi:hypothetical protein E4U42_003473 [Claviceps africana]|uniref:glycogenin glucosyltransferase n=1 Tax=Claviceps africana TaxID=83212 RepID=A0A8K0J7V2_9HYPO|nr:hypothetical protein E4U42_003473 [Claviceps africana]